MRSIKLTVALALCAGCSAPFTYPDLAKAKDTYAHALKNGDPKKFPKEYDDAKKSIGAAQSAQDAQASFEHGKDRRASVTCRRRPCTAPRWPTAPPLRPRPAPCARPGRRSSPCLQKEWDEKGAAANDAAARAEAERAAREAEAARKRLQKFAEVKEDERGTIITLAGGIPFKTGKADLPERWPSTG